MKHSNSLKLKRHDHNHNYCNTYNIIMGLVCLLNITCEILIIPIMVGEPLLNYIIIVILEYYNNIVVGTSICLHKFGENIYFILFPKCAILTEILFVIIKLQINNI